MSTHSKAALKLGLFVASCRRGGPITFYGIQRDKGEHFTETSLFHLVTSQRLALEDTDIADLILTRVTLAHTVIIEQRVRI